MRRQTECGRQDETLYETKEICKDTNDLSDGGDGVRCGVAVNDSGLLRAAYGARVDAY